MSSTFQMVPGQVIAFVYHMMSHSLHEKSQIHIYVWMVFLHNDCGLPWIVLNVCFCIFVLFVGSVEALNKIISHWNLGTKLNFSGVDPCTQNATWAPDSTNPQIACHCAGTTCHVTRLSVPPSSFSLYFLYTWWCTRFGSIWFWIKIEYWFQQF